jgi:hypothetical protein
VPGRDRTDDGGGDGTCAAKACPRPGPEELHEVMAVHTDAIGAQRSAGTEPIRPDVIFRITSMTRPVTAAQSRASAERTNPARCISASEYEETLKYSFTIGSHGYNWSWNSCWKDTVSKDGLGLPGHHSCGASRVLRTARYLG